MAKKTTQNEELKIGGGLLKDQVELVKILDEGFKGLGEKIQDAFSDMTDSLEGNLDLTEKIAKSYERDITGALKKMARSLDTNISLQLKMNRGQNVSKDLLKEKDKLTTTYLKTEGQISKSMKDRPKEMAKVKGMMFDIFHTQMENLEAMEEENKLNQKQKGFYKLSIESLSKMADKIDESGTLSSILAGNFKDAYTHQRMFELTAASTGNFLYKAFMEVDKIMTGLNKQFGFTDSTARSIQTRFGDIAASSSSTLMSFRDIHKAAEAITEATGIFAGTLRKDVLDGAAQALVLMGLTGEAVARLALNAQTTGQHFEDQNLSMAAGLIIAEQTVGVTLDGNMAFQEAANATGLIRANLGRNYETIVNTVGQAQALGLTLQDLAGISSNLLNFQSSIEAELQAELFTGKQLNLEKARLYALTGDYNNLQKEVMKNVGSEYEFLSMNVLAKEKYAAALGMSVDQMSNLVMKNADLAKIEEQARLGGRQDIIDNMKQLDLQTKMNKLIEKVQTSFVTMADGGLGKVASLMSTILESSTLLYGIIGAIAGIKLMGLITGMLALAAAQKSAAITGAAASFARNPLAGIAIMAGIGLLVGAVGSTINSAASEPLPEINMKHGGIVTPKNGGMRANIAEGGQAEAVIPLTELYKLFKENSDVQRETNRLILAQGKNGTPGIYTGKFGS
tara:strand:- start:1206 stop:3248 length:2043 start_codon:yes stop_codon:yes gene_type:complete